MNEGRDNSSPQPGGRVNLSSLEMQSLVQCETVRLVSAGLTPLIPGAEAQPEVQAGFRMRVVVSGDKAYAYLEVQLTAGVEDDEDPDEIYGYRLNFVLLGVFASALAIQPAELGEFTRMNALATMWPYAREYAGDQFQRAGEPEITLPVIDPQSVTQRLVETGQLEIVLAGE